MVADIERSGCCVGCAQVCATASPVVANNSTRLVSLTIVTPSRRAHTPCQSVAITGYSGPDTGVLSQSLSNMTQTNPTVAQPSNFPWALGAGFVGSLCAGLTFLFTHSWPVSALIAAVVILSLFAGWVSATIWREPGPAVIRDSPAPEVTNRTEDGPDAVSNAMRFALKAIEATPNPVIVLDENGWVVMTNQAARSRFSIAQSRTRFAHVIRRPDLLEAVESALINRTPTTLMIETRLPVDRFERASIAAFDVGANSFVMVTIADETEVRMSERMRADFLANASHELRTPLAAIIGFIETLRGPAREDEKARDRFLEVMHLQADRMSRLISDLLSLSRIELNEHVPPTGQSDIATVVLEAVDSLQPKQKDRVVCDIAHQPLWVLGDRDEMTQVVLNLIDNALKYSPEGSKVRLTLKQNLSRENALVVAMRQWQDAARLPLTSPDIERGRLYHVLRVDNEGDGIERQFLPRLAERFFRIEDSASGTSGTGLGLAIVKHIVSRHRAGLTVESELGRGSAFAVYLPVPHIAEMAPEIASDVAVTKAS
jgi:two-component system, OmpR family, phosphate regulon sensor histidine kinase PhoR